MMMIRILHKSLYNKMLDSDKYLIYNTSMKYEIKH